MTQIIEHPPTLTARDIGVKDLLDVFYLQGGSRNAILYAIAINPRQSISMDLSDVCQKAADEAVARILAEFIVSSHLTDNSGQ
jgi:hydrogenase maturation protease